MQTLPLSCSVRDAVDELLEGLREKTINCEDHESQVVVLQALIGKVEETVRGVGF